MATVRFVEPEHVDILRDYLGCNDGGAVVLVYPDAQTAVENAGLTDGESVDYSFGGGDPDLMVEVVSSESHYFVSEVTGG